MSPLIASDGRFATSSDENLPGEPLAQTRPPHGLFPPDMWAVPDIGSLPVDACPAKPGQRPFSWRVAKSSSRVGVCSRAAAQSSTLEHSMRRVRFLIIPAAVACGLFFVPSAHAAAPPIAPGAPADAPAYNSAVPSPGPQDLTWAQLKAVENQPSSFSDPSSAQPAPTPSGSMSTNAVIKGPGGVSCTIDASTTYKRTSGTGYQYGTVGSKPVTQCTVVMVKISHSANIYKTVWWGAQHVAGPINASNMGEGRLEQKNIEKPCDDLRSTTFYTITRSTGTFPTGASGTATGTTANATLACGTNP